MSAASSPSVRAELVQLLAAEAECRIAYAKGQNVAFAAHFQALSRSAKHIRRLLANEAKRRAADLAETESPPRGGQIDLEEFLSGNSR